MLSVFIFAFTIGIACLAQNVFANVPNVVILAPAAGLCLAAAYWCGVRRSASSRPSRRLVRGVIWASVACALLALPIALRWLSIWHVLDSIPIPAEASRVHREMKLGLWERNRWWCHVRYVTHQPFEEADESMRNAFIANGWEIDDEFAERHFSPTEPIIVGAARTFEHPPVEGRVQVYTFDRFPDEWLLVWLYDVGDERWFQAAWMR